MCEMMFSGAIGLDPRGASSTGVEPSPPPWLSCAEAWLARTHLPRRANYFAELHLAKLIPLDSVGPVAAPQHGDERMRYIAIGVRFIDHRPRHLVPDHLSKVMTKVAS